jgi:hypothetical protein
MLPPVLETYLVWHPDDHAGTRAAHQVVEHVHGPLFTGLIGGAIEVYVRHQGWRSAADAPRPIPVPGSPPPNGVAQAQYVAVVPVLGVALARVVQPGSGAWFDYLTALMAAHETSAQRVRIFPLLLADSVALRGHAGRPRWLRGGLTSTLLDPEALRELRVGVSVSEGPDLGRLGLLETHFRLALAEMARALLLGGCWPTAVISSPRVTPRSWCTRLTGGTGVISRC